MTATYDRIGVGYGLVRRPDPRLTALIHAALGDAELVLNVGAGAGSYEPTDRQVVAAEPSQVMLGQHPGLRRVRAVAGALPFGSRSFDAAMAIMAVHHWPDLLVGLDEMRRVAARQVVFTWDPEFDRELWVVSEYVPQIRAIEHARFTPLSTLVSALDAHTVRRFEIPWDFSDGYQPAFGHRPEAYLDPSIRAASSTFAQLPDSVVEPAMDRLRRDLQSGAWHERHRGLLDSDRMDFGYRLVVAG